MKCKRHPSQEIVALCNECNVGLCGDCADATQSLQEDYGTLCIPCYTKELNNMKSWYVEKRESVKKKIITSCVLYGIGLVLILVGLLDKQSSFMMSVFGVFCCGFYNAIKGWKRGEEEHEEYERKHGASYTVTSDGIEYDDGFFKKLLIAAIYTVIGVIVTPFSVISNISKRKKYLACIEELEQEIARVSVI